MVERPAERHPNITMARDIAFQGRHDEGVLERTNLILYKRFRENVDEWRKLRAEDFQKSGIETERLMAIDVDFSFVLPWEAFRVPEYKFTNFPHSDVVGLLSSFRNGALHVYVNERNIGIVSQSRGCGFVFQFDEENLITRGAGSTEFGFSDPMEGKSLMTKVSAAAEFVDFVDLSLNALKAQAPAKAS